MKRVNQFIAGFSLIFILSTVMLWILNKMVNFLGLMFLHPMKAFGYLVLGTVLIYGLSKVKELL
jgi:hypothetical protein